MASLRRQETLPSVILVITLTLLTWFSFNFFENQKPDLTEIYGKKWRLVYIVKDGKKIFERSIWIKFYAPDNPLPSCKQLYSDLVKNSKQISISNEFICAEGYDGCNEFTLIFDQRVGYTSSSLMGCPMWVTYDANGNIIGSSVAYDSDWFYRSLDGLPQVINNLLKFSSSKNPTDYILFRLEENK